jgi:hypothetical protein
LKLEVGKFKIPKFSAFSLLNFMNAQEILNREFLEMRCKILELAASLDRLDRAEGNVLQESRYGKVLEAITVLLQKDIPRAEQIQLLFSREYSTNWPQTFEISLSQTE